MRRLQLPRVVSASKAVTSALVLFALVCFAPAKAQAQITITSGWSNVTVPVGDVELPLTATGGNSANYVWSIVGGSTPPGLVIRHDVPPWFQPGVTTGLIGIATAPGSYSFDLQVTDGVSTSAPTNVTINISTLSIVTPGNLPDGFQGAAYSVQLQAFDTNLSGGPLTWAPNGSLPAGLTIASNGVLSASSLTTGGFVNVPVSVSNNTQTIYWTFNLNISTVQILTDGMLPAATVGSGYSQTLTASGGTAPYTFSSNGFFPFGISMDGAGNITGSTTSPGRYTGIVTVTDSANPSHFYTKSVTLIVLPSPGVSPLPEIQPYGDRFDDCSVGVNCTRGIGNFSGSQPPYVWSASGLPDGMYIRSGSGVTSSWVSVGDGEIYGSPTAAGNYTVTITVTDGSGATATNTYPLKVAALWPYNYPQNGTMGVPFTFTFRTVGGSGTYSVAQSGGSLPLGLTLSPSGVSGTPQEGGFFNQRFTFDDGAGHSITQATGFYIANAGSTSQQLQITDGDLGNVVLNQFYSRHLNACCRQSAITFTNESGAPPTGITMSSAGQLSGTPTVAGPHTWVVRATDTSNGDYTIRQLTINVTPLFFTTNSFLPYGNVGTVYPSPNGGGITLAVGGTVNPVTFTLASGSYLPPGLTLDSSGFLHGTPTSSGQFYFTVNATDIVSLQKTSMTFWVSIYAAGAHPPLQISTNGNFGTFSLGSIQLELDAFNGAPFGAAPLYHWSVVSGSLPPGMSLRTDFPGWFSPSASGGLIGVATTPGTYNFTLRVTDSDGTTRDLASTLRITGLSIKDLWNFPNGFLNVPYSYTLTPLGNNNQPVTWSTQTCTANPFCQMPQGLSLNPATGEISGTPTLAGFYNVPVTITSNGVSVSWNFNISINKLNVTASPTLAGGGTYELQNATTGQFYSVTFSAPGGTAPITFSSNSLPCGLTLNQSSGVVSGTYCGSGRFQFSITATDSTSTSYTRQFVIRGVSSPAVLPAIVPYSNRFDDCTIGMGCLRGLFVSTNVPAPFTWSASGLPNGMSLRLEGTAYNNDTSPAGDAMLWGVPLQTGDFNVVVTVTDANGAQVSQTFPLHVSELWQDVRLVNGTYLTSYNSPLRILGGNGSYTSQVMFPAPNNRLPNGVSYDGNSNTASGTPTETGQFSPDLLINDGAGHHLRAFNFFFISDSGNGTIQINTASDLGYFTANPTNNSALNLTFNACCPSTGLTWSVVSGSLPTGTTLNASTGVLSGPLNAGTYTFVLKASAGASNFAVKQFTMVVTPLTPAKSQTLPYGNINQTYPADPAAAAPGGGVQLALNGATGATTFALAPYQFLPPGLTLSSSGLLSGVPTATGQFNFTVNATDSANNSLRMFLSVAIYPAGQFPPFSLNLGPTLGPFPVGQVTFALSTAITSGGSGGYLYSYSPNAAPVPGMRFQNGQPLPTNYELPFFNPVPTAAFIGIVDTPGSYLTSIRVTDSMGHTFDKAITVIVSPLNITSLSPLPKATVGSPYSFFLTAAGGTAPYSWTSSLLPTTGLSLDPATGELHGTPTGTPGSLGFSVTLTDSASNAVTVSYQLQRNGFAITSNGFLPAATSGVSYSQQLTAPGCASCVWSAPNGGLPSGFSVSAGGLLSGTANTTGTFNFTIRATGGGNSVDKQFTLVFKSTLPQALAITNGTTFGMTTVGFSPTTQLLALGGTAPYSWSLVGGALPPGVSVVNSGQDVDGNLNSTGYVLGKPLQTGTYSFTLQVTDAVAATATQTFSWTISSLNLQYTNLPVKDSNNNLYPAPGQPLNRGQAYSQPLLAIGGDGNYTWSAPGMPAGLTLDANGLLHGTPQDSTPINGVNPTVTITDTAGHTLIANPNIVINANGATLQFNTGPNLGTFSQGSSVSTNLSPSGGTPGTGVNPAYIVTPVGALPPGFALETGNAVLSNGTAGQSFFLAGAPTTPGVYTFTLALQDFATPTPNVAERTFTITISPISILSNSPLPDGSVGAPYSTQLVAFDNVGSLTWSVSPGSGLPAGLTLSSSGLLSGTPTTKGNYSFNVAARDSSTGITVTPLFSLNVSSLAINAPATLPLATSISFYSYTFTATGALGTVQWSIQAPNGLPGGLSINQGTATISGTPLNGSPVTSLTVTATDIVNNSAVSSVTRRFTLPLRQVNVLPPSTSLTSSSLPDGTVGQGYSFTLTQNAGLEPYTWTLAMGSSLPPGLTLVSGAQLPATAFPGSTLIAGQPTAAGQYSFDLVLTDANGASSTHTFTINVSTINILAGGLRTAFVNQAYAEQLTVVGGTGPYTFTASPLQTALTNDVLPPGSPDITLSSSGLLSGTPTSTGNYTFLVRAQDASGQTFARAYTLVVNSVSTFPTLRITNQNPGDTYVGSGFSQTLSALKTTNSNGSSVTCACTWAVTSGSLPLGLSISQDPMNLTSADLVGTTSVAGTYHYTLTATDTTSALTAAHAFTLTVSPMQVVSPPIFRYAVEPDAYVGTPYSTTIKVAGGTPPYTFVATANGPAPPGMTVSSTGTLSGTPTQPGLYGVSLIATDAAAHVYHLPTLSFVVMPAGAPKAPMAATQNTVLMSDASLGVMYRFPLVMQRGGTAPFTWSVTSGSSLPPGLAILAGSNGVSDYISGTPTAPGQYSFSLTVTDSTNQTMPVLFQMGVSPLAITPERVAPAHVGVFYSTSFTPSGGTGPYTIQTEQAWDIPPGLTLSSAGVLSGTPTAPGIFVMRIHVNDSASNQLSKVVYVGVDNAAGQSPAVTFSAGGIQLSYEQGSPDPGAVVVPILTTSDSPAYSIALESAPGTFPGATLSTSGGNAPDSVSLNLNVTNPSLGPGTYTGLLAMKSTSTNLFDSVPVTLTITAPPPCNYAVSPGSTTVGAAGGSGSFALQTNGNCSWTATVSDPSMIALTSAASGSGPATMTYTVGSNALASQRSGTITINGAVYTITQFGSACSFAINPSSLNAPAGGGTAQVNVTASDQSCTWTASSATLGVAPTTQQTGDGVVNITIPPNPNPGSVAHSATIGGQIFNVLQGGIDCTVSLNPSAASFADSGGLGSAQVNTPSTCTYATASSPSWVNITSGGSGTGTSTINYTVSANSATTPRSGSIVIGGQALTISQAAAACSVTIDTSMLGSPYSKDGGTGTIGVTANGDNCSWSVSGSANWAAFSPGASAGNGSVSLTIAQNPTVTPRSATLLIAGQSVTITQAGQACSYALQSPSGSVPAAGGSGSVGVLTPSACTWAPASSDPSWLTVGSGGSGSGDASFIATANPDPAPRSATITIQSQTFTVTQPAAPCTFTLDSSTASASGDGVAGATFGVTTGSASCVAAPVSYANWLTVNNTSANGTSATVTYSVAPNPYATPRSGVIQVGDQSFTVTQDMSQSACRYSLHAYGAVFSRSGGGGDVFGAASVSGCDPTPTIGTDQPSFITLFPLQPPVDSIFTLPFNVSPYDTPLTAVIRRGRITFGGQIFIVKQVSW